MVSSALSSASTKNYDKNLKSFLLFSKQFKLSKAGFPLNVGQVILYLSHLQLQGYASSTIVSTLSSLNYFQKIRGFPDLNSHFLLTKFLTGMSKSSPSVDARLPITPAILRQLVSSVIQVSKSSSETILFQAMLSLSFFAFFRPGEVTSSPNNLSFQQIQFSKHKVLITFTKFKHYHGNSVTIAINKQPHTCPVALLSKYISARGTHSGPLFCFQDGSPISYSYYRNVFTLLQSFTSLGSKYHLHSLRIGAATHAASQGIPEETIKRMGRWHSQAVLKYIRIPTFVI